MGKGRRNNPTVNAKKENIDKLMEKVKAAKVKSAEEQWKELLASMSEEEAKLFIEKLEVAAKEAEFSEREKAIQEIQDTFGEIEAELDRRVAVAVARDNRQEEIELLAKMKDWLKTASNIDDLNTKMFLDTERANNEPESLNELLRLR